MQGNSLNFHWRQKTCGSCGCLLAITGHLGFKEDPTSGKSFFLKHATTKVALTSKHLLQRVRTQVKSTNRFCLLKSLCNVCWHAMNVWVSSCFQQAMLDTSHAGKAQDGWRDSWQNTLFITVSTAYQPLPLQFVVQPAGDKKEKLKQLCNHWSSVKPTSHQFVPQGWLTLQPSQLWALTEAFPEARAYIKPVNHHFPNFLVLNKLARVASHSVMTPCFLKISLGLPVFRSSVEIWGIFEVSLYQIQLDNGFKIN